MFRFKVFLNEYKKPILIALGILLLTLVMFFQSEGELNLIADYDIERDDYLGQKKNVILDINVGDKTFENVEIDVDRQKYTDKELHEMFIASHDLIKDLLDIDTGRAGVSEDLSFDTTFPGSPLTYEYIPLDKDIIDESGKILTPAETITSVKVIASYGEWSESCIFEFKISPSQEIKERYVKEAVEKEISLKNVETANERTLSLPQIIEGIPIKYQEKSKGKNYKILVGGIVFSLFVFMAALYDKKNEIEGRKK